MDQIDVSDDKPKILDFSNLRGDMYGGLTAGIVALPLALAFGAGVFEHNPQLGAVAGLWGAIIVGFFAAAFGGTNTQISGPTGPMVVVFAGLLASLVDQLAITNPDLTPADLTTLAIPLLFAAVVLGGLIQIAMGLLKTGQYIKLVPYPVISGFMSGIGVIIILLQLSRLFGGAPEGGKVYDALQAIPTAIANPDFFALGLGLFSLALLFFWPKSINKYLPGTLATLIIGTLIGLLLPGIPLLGNIDAGLPALSVPEFSQSTILIVIKAAFILAILGAIDSLLTSLVADNVTRTRHNSDQELIGQGIANTIAGFFTALPGAGATMRTMVNVRTGGETKLSGMIHGLTLLAIVLVASPLAEKIPFAVLAGILIKVGYDIIDFTYLKNALKGPRWDLFLMLLVLGLTVFVDLIVAVGAGVFLAALAYVKQVADQQTEAVKAEAPDNASDADIEILEQADGQIMLFDFGGPLSFGAAADLGHHVRQRTRRGTAAIVLDFARVPFIDVSAARAVETIAIDAKEAGKHVFLCNLSTAISDKLTGLHVDEHLDMSGSLQTRLDALRAALRAISGRGDRPDNLSGFGSAVPAE